MSHKINVSVPSMVFGVQLSYEFYSQAHSVQVCLEDNTGEVRQSGWLVRNVFSSVIGHFYPLIFLGDFSLGPSAGLVSCIGFPRSC